MNSALAAGAVLTAVGLVGYAAGVAVAFPGRAFAVTAVMAGITLLAMRKSFGASP